MKNYTFQEKIEANNQQPKTFTTVKELSVLLTVVDRNNPASSALFEVQVNLKFWNGEARLGGSDRLVYVDDETYINYSVRSMALSYFSHLNYSEKPDDVQKFIQATKNKTWYFDSIIL